MGFLFFYVIGDWDVADYWLQVAGFWYIGAE